MGKKDKKDKKKHEDESEEEESEEYVSDEEDKKKKKKDKKKDKKKKPKDKKKDKKDSDRDNDDKKKEKNNKKDKKEKTKKDKKNKKKKKGEESEDEDDHDKKKQRDKHTSSSPPNSLSSGGGFVAGIFAEDDCAPVALGGAATPPPAREALPLPTEVPRGKMRALIIGINYLSLPPGKGQLRGCINDAHTMARFASQHWGFSSDCIRVLTDDNPDMMPTRANIEQSLDWLTRGVGAGYSLLLHYSGHGGQEVDTSGREEDGMNETILPVDWRAAGMIVDDVLHDKVIRPLPAGCRLTAVFDSCHSQSVLDLPWIYRDREHDVCCASFVLLSRLFLSSCLGCFYSLVSVVFMLLSWVF
eukprot:TRINITY_DN5302_c0_g1_i6.p1 TRINITY_DN5302_c0_g1~~TRINITY_DN5302_c0_g1_i6.p1  ORF type:complete len:357 (-),score=131.86 TRINITY_DN5302_c0_g1_i6:83-1153(-)